MDNEPYDYRQYDQIWRRVSPQENPYPEARTRTSGNAAGNAPAGQTHLMRPTTSLGRAAEGTQRPQLMENNKVQQTPLMENNRIHRPELMQNDMTRRPEPMRTGGMWPSEPAQDDGTAMRALLREELRHMGEMLHLLENALA